MRIAQDTDEQRNSTWRTLRGPNDDWPLLLLDWQSVDVAGDQVINDIVYADEAGENFALHSNPQHKWCYLSAQEKEDVFVFRACGSADRDTIRKSSGAWREACNQTKLLPGAFHVAAENPLTPPDQPFRESIDVRLVAFLD
jgi:hypothetical protein